MDKFDELVDSESALRMMIVLLPEHTVEVFKKYFTKFHYEENPDQPLKDLLNG